MTKPWRGQLALGAVGKEPPYCVRSVRSQSAGPIATRIGRMADRTALDRFGRGMEYPKSRSKLRGGVTITVEVPLALTLITWATLTPEGYMFTGWLGQ